jgi:hypothetical protein
LWLELSDVISEQLHRNVCDHWFEDANLGDVDGVGGVDRRESDH